MSRIVWSAEAVSDLEAIREYIGRDSPEYAALLVERFVTAVGRLAEFPESGRTVPEIGDPAVREVLCGSYRIVYRVAHEGVTILAVYHGARLMRFD